MNATSCWSIGSGFCGNGDDSQFMQMACCSVDDYGECVGEATVDDDLLCKQWITKHFSTISQATDWLNELHVGPDAKILQGASPRGVDILYRGYLSTGKKTPLTVWQKQHGYPK